MERTMIAINVPNFLSIGLMAVGFFLLFGLVVQLVKRAMPSGGEATSADDAGGGLFVEGADYVPA